MRGLPFFLAWCVLGQTAVVVDVGVIEGNDFRAVPGYAVLSVWNDSVRGGGVSSPPPPPGATPPPVGPPATDPPSGPPATDPPSWVIYVAIGSVCVAGLVGAIVWWERHRAAVGHEAQPPRPRVLVKIGPADHRRN